MSEETPMVVTTTVQLVHQVQAEPPAIHVALATPTQEQIEAANKVFAHQGEADLMAGLAGMWAGTLVLHGLAEDTFRDEEEEPENKPRPVEP
jgi:hypothetical protein